MVHLARLLTSTKTQVCFISKTRNSSIRRTSLINHFNASDAFVVPAVGQSGGLWLIWNDQVDVNIVDHSSNYIFALCKNNLSSQQFALVCIYGDPHHRTTDAIWTQVQNFVVTNSNLPTLCMGDMNDIMHPNEKSGPFRPDLRRINAFCDHVKQCGFIDLGYSGPAYTWSNKRFSSTPMFQRLDRSLANAEWCLAFPRTTVYHLLLFLLSLILIADVLINFSVLRIGGSWNRITNQWHSKARIVLPPARFHRRHITLQ
jgi:hypothetical protein